jgi:hypothetical protein
MEEEAMEEGREREDRRETRPCLVAYQRSEILRQVLPIPRY